MAGVKDETCAGTVNGPTAFALAAVPEIVFGPGRLADVGAPALALAGGRERLVLLVADPGLLGVTAAASEALASAGLEVAVFDAFHSDPSLAQVDAGAALARDTNAAVVVAVGGGSTLDIGKLIAAVAAADAPAETYALCANPLPRDPLGKICVPTTHGTGSETTRTAVVSDAGGHKLWCWGNPLRADTVILDPELTVGLPPGLTAATGADALVHAMEAATNRNANPGSDVYAFAAIRHVTRWLPRAIAQPGDLEARGMLLLAAAHAGIAVDNAGTSIAHTIGHALASLRPIHHGRAVALAMRATLPWNVEDGDARWAAVAEALGGPREASAVPGLFERLLRTSGVAITLDGADDLRPEDLAAEMATAANRPMRLANRRTVSDDDLLRFAHAVLASDRCGAGP
jgi:alcohol dehydrogenase class IV